MNYVILNGKKSTDIKGLLIQSLPPISKPLMRTEIEEIDGRDGDIVTKLGYSAYNKEMTIGLFGSFNVDGVISYFDSEGIVTFSNEPDKYYNYQIIEQIDFERLIRFKTATVTFHVQPFKYSTVDKKFTLKRQLISFESYTETKNGISLSASNGVISVSGTGSAATEFYMPINPVTLSAGNYTLEAKTSGSNASACSIRLINDVPSNADSFGSNYIGLTSDDVTLSDTLTADKTYQYIWFYINPSVAMSFTLDIELVNNDVNSISLINRGNTVSKPIVTLYGSGTIDLLLNGTQILEINLGTEEYITIDAAKMDAYKDGVLKNRLVTGDYSNLALKTGNNTISWTGNVTEIDVEDFSRWI